MALSDDQEARLLAACSDAGLGFPRVTLPGAGSDFWVVEFPQIPLRVEGWPGGGVDGFTHLVQQIHASGAVRRQTKLQFLGGRT